MATSNHRVKRFVAAEPEKGDAAHLTDLGNAKRVVHRHGKATEANDTAVSNFARWWAEVRGRLLLIPHQAEDSQQAEAATKLFILLRDHNPKMLGEPEATVGMNSVFVEPAALRGLLVRLGVRVECSFEATNSKKKLTPGRGRGPSYLLKRAVLTWRGEHEADASTYQYTCTPVSFPPRTIAVDLLAG